MLEGVDVSHHQAPIDWGAVARHRVSFAYCRATYGTRSDRRFLEHAVGSRDAGLNTGAYHFFRQTQGAEEQFEAFDGELERIDTSPGDLAPCVDLEWNEKYDGKVNPDLFNSAGRNVCAMTREKWGVCLVYLAPGFWELLGRPDWLLNFPWWVAHWGVNEPYQPPGAPAWSLWQYTNKGRVPGVAGDVDRNKASELICIPDEPPPPSDGWKAKVRQGLAQITSGVATIRDALEET